MQIGSVMLIWYGRSLLYLGPDWSAFVNEERTIDMKKMWKIAIEEIEVKLEVEQTVEERKMLVANEEKTNKQKYYMRKWSQENNEVVVLKKVDMIIAICV